VRDSNQAWNEYLPKLERGELRQPNKAGKTQSKRGFAGSSEALDQIDLSTTMPRGEQNHEQFQSMPDQGFPAVYRTSSAP